MFDHLPYQDSKEKTGESVFVENNLFVEHEHLWLSCEECGEQGVARIIDITGTITNNNMQ